MIMKSKPVLLFEIRIPCKNDLPLTTEVFILINLKEVVKGYERGLLRNGSAVRKCRIHIWGDQRMMGELNILSGFRF